MALAGRCPVAAPGHVTIFLSPFLPGFFLDHRLPWCLPDVFLQPAACHVRRRSALGLGRTRHVWGYGWRETETGATPIWRARQLRPGGLCMAGSMRTGVAAPEAAGAGRADAECLNAVQVHPATLQGPAPRLKWPTFRGPRRGWRQSATSQGGLTPASQKRFMALLSLGAISLCR